VIKKIVYEAVTMWFVKEKMNISMLSVISWGHSYKNPLGLGAFIIMEFIEGVSYDVILR
jgi:hypothetical protein